MFGVELSWLHCDEREQAYIILDWVIIAAAFAVLRVSNVLGGLLGPVVRRTSDKMEQGRVMTFGGTIWTMTEGYRQT